MYLETSVETSTVEWDTNWDAGEFGILVKVGYSLKGVLVKLDQEYLGTKYSGNTDQKRNTSRNGGLGEAIFQPPPSLFYQTSPQLT